MGSAGPKLWSPWVLPGTAPPPALSCIWLSNLHFHQPLATLRDTSIKNLRNRGHTGRKPPSQPQTSWPPHWRPGMLCRAPEGNDPATEPTAGPRGATDPAPVLPAVPPVPPHLTQAQTSQGADLQSRRKAPKELLRAEACDDTGGLLALPGAGTGSSLNVTAPQNKHHPYFIDLHTGNWGPL